MMREIKFRAFYKGERYPIFKGGLEGYEKPRMIYNIQDIYDGSGADDSGNGVGHVSCFGSFLDDEDYIVGQYTGLKDKNGGEIYEGDILSSEESSMVKTLRNWGVGETEIEEKWKHEELWVVEYRKGYFQITRPQKRNKDKLGYVLAHNTSSEPDDLEVIGNIYENPELLGDSQ